jgi:hypothetical protein
MGAQVNGHVTWAWKLLLANVADSMDLKMPFQVISSQKSLITFWTVYVFFFDVSFRMAISIFRFCEYSGTGM